MVARVSCQLGVRPPPETTLNVISQVAHGNAVPGRLIALNSVYALLYSAAAVAGAVLIFERRNLK